VQLPCGDRAEPGHQDRHSHEQATHRGTKEVTMKDRTLRASRDPHAERDEWLTVEEVCTELKISRIGRMDQALHLEEP
jgi:hypothetical protein